MQDFLNAVSLLPKDVEALLSAINGDFKAKVNEIRFRSNKPVTLNTKEGVFYCTKNGRVTINYNDDSILKNFKTDIKNLIIYGICKRCQEREKN